MNSDELLRENAALRDRLAPASVKRAFASPRSLELQLPCCREVLDSARSLTGARYGSHHRPARRSPDDAEEFPLLRDD